MAAVERGERKLKLREKREVSTVLTDCLQVMTYYLTSVTRNNNLYRFHNTDQTDFRYVFEMAGLTGNIDLIASGIEYALYLVFTGITFYFIDRKSMYLQLALTINSELSAGVGRRPILIFGAIGMGACLMTVGGV